MTGSKQGFPRRGEVWLINLDPVVGNEIGKTRPGLIISNDVGNQYAGTVTVLPLTSNTLKLYPFEALVRASDSGLKKDSKVKCDQIRTVSKKRLVKCLTILSQNEMLNVEQALSIHLGLG